MTSQVKILKLKVGQIKKIKPDVFVLSFNSPYLAKVGLPGNFLHIKIASVILRRPFSIHKVVGNVIYILFRVRGRGTKALSRIKPGEALDLIGPLGKGFDFELKPKEVTANILVAGGIGVAPLVFLAQKLAKAKNTVFLGVKNKKELLGEKEFKKLGFKLEVATEDGSRGFKGTVINLLKQRLATTGKGQGIKVYACGPKEMFFELSKILKKYPKLNCQVSFEQFMGCGLGICCACVIETKNGYKKVCKEGPVFNIRDIR